MPATPQAPIATNQAIMTGPNSRPTAAVPRRWTANSSTMITAVRGTTSSSSAGSITFTPSTAESTEIAGVIMLSPKNSAAPKNLITSTGVRPSTAVSYPRCSRSRTT